MSIPPLPGPDHFDAYVHGLLPHDEVAAVERNVAQSAEWLAARDAARWRRDALTAALPPVEPRVNLVTATIDRIAARDAARSRRKRRVLALMFGPLAVAATVLVALQLELNSLQATPANLEVFGQNTLLAGSTPQLRIRVTHGLTQAPLAGWQVNPVLIGPDNVPVVTAPGQTDANGTCAVSVPMTDKMPVGTCTLEVSASGGSQPEPEVVRVPVTLRRDAKLMLSSDKPVYQPGQTIRLRSLTLRKPDLKPVAETKSVFAVSDPKGNVVFKQTGTTSKFGIASADCPLATEILEGRYTVRCQVGETESSLAVEVQKYVLPKFKIGIDLDQSFYQPGQTVRAAVRTDYFHGKPVTGGTLDVDVRANDPNGPIVDQRRLTTGEGGTATFDFRLPDSLAGRPQDDGDAKFVFTVTAQDSAGQKQSRTVTRPITSQALKIEIIPENGTIVPGTVNKVYLYAGTADGRPAKADLTVIAAGQTSRLTTSDLGVATFELPPALEKPSAVIVEATDGRGHTGRREVQLSEAAAGDFLLRVATSGATLHIVTIGAGAQPVFLDIIKDGQTVRSEVTNPSAFEYTTYGRASYASHLALDIPPDWAGTYELCGYHFPSDGLPLRKLRTFYVRPARQVDVKATLDKPEHRPGETAKLSFALTDDKGKPTPGALSLAAVDEAVFSVLESMPGMEKTFFLLEQDLMKPVYSLYRWSPDGPPAADRAEFEQALFARTVRTMGLASVTPRGGIAAGTEGDDPNPHTLRVETYPDKRRAIAARKFEGMEKVTTGWAWLAALSALAVYSALWLTLSDRPTARSVLGVVGILALLSPLLLQFQSVRERGAGTARMEVLMNQSENLRQAGSDWRRIGVVDYMSTSGAGSPGDPPRVRELFPETLLWRPELITDDHGRASLDLELADSITTWRLAASAVTADGRLGSLQAPLRVFQPFFVDLNLPVALTRGDEVSVPVVVSNFLPRPQTVELSLGETPWAERVGDADQWIELMANEVKAVSYRLRVKQVGSHTLQVTAKGDGISDAIKRSIEVVPDGRRVEQVVSGTLSEPASVNVDVPANAIDGSARLLVKLYPSSFSQLVEGLDAIFQMPYGCFEQTSSTTYPNVLALDYLKRMGRSNPQVEAKARQYVHLGYQRLLSFEVPGGGFDWYGRAPADVALTAYGLMEFTDMARVHDVDPALIQRTRNWLIKQRRPDGAWLSSGRFNAGAGDATLRTTAYVAWAVFQDPAADIDRGPTLNYLLAHKPQSLADPDPLALVCNAILSIDAKHSVLPAYLNRLDILKKTSPDGQKYWWELADGSRTAFYGAGVSASVETTALAALAFLRAGDRPGTVRQALAWLAAQKDARGTWHSTQATVLALKALLAGSAKQEDGERRFEVLLEGEPPRTVVIAADQAEVMKQLDLSDGLRPGVAKRLTIRELTKSAAGFQVASRHHVPAGDSKPQSPNEVLALDLQYNRESLGVGDTLTAAVTVTNRTAKVAPMVMLDLPIPAGFVVDAEAFEKLVRENAIAKFQTTPRQMIVYLRELSPRSPLKFDYSLRPTMPVTVTVPPARVYEYYAPEREGRSAGGRLTVTAR